MKFMTEFKLTYETYKWKSKLSIYRINYLDLVNIWESMDFSKPFKPCERFEQSNVKLIEKKILVKIQRLKIISEIENI